VKISITGVPSAGKTTLARAIGAHTGVRVFELDGLMFVDDRWTLRAADERDAMLAVILAEPSFVTEGGFLGWTEGVFASADHIIWLDPPLLVLTWRHVRRHWRHARGLPSLLAFQWRMYLRAAGRGPLKSDPTVTRDGIARALRPYADKVYRVRGGVTAEDVIARLALSG
jgi:adenylate kinase family enzyme